MTGIGHVRRFGRVFGFALVALLAPVVMLARADVAVGPLTFAAPLLVDHQYPYSSAVPFDTVSCASTTLCVGDAGAGDDAEESVPANVLAVSTDPAGGSPSDWSLVQTTAIDPGKQGYALSGVSCVSGASFCLAEGTGGSGASTAGVILTSSDPAGGPTAWQVTDLPSLPGLYRAPTCVSASGQIDCVAGTIVGGSDDNCLNGMVVSNDPSGGSASDWTVITPGWLGAGCLGGGSGTGTDTGADVSCASTTLCMAIGGADNYFVVTNAASTGSGGQWQTNSQSADSITDTVTSTSMVGTDSVSCATGTTFCLVGGTDASGPAVATTDDAGATTPTWTITQVTSTELSFLAAPVSCFPDSAAAAPDHVICQYGQLTNGAGYHGTVYESLNGGATWTADNLTEPRSTPTGEPSAFACAGPAGGASSFCLAGTTTGAVLDSTDPGAGATAAWSTAAPVAPGTSDVEPAPQSCPSASLCVLADGGGNVVSATSPASGSWSTGNVDPNGIAELACPSASLCVAFDPYGDVLQSTNPGGGSSTWSAPSLADGTNGDVDALDCPSTGLCVAMDAGGNVLESTNPAAGKWSPPANVDSLPANDGTIMACPTTTLCVATDPNGDVIESTSPATGAWSTPKPIDAGNDPFELACAPDGSVCVASDGNDMLGSPNPGAGDWTIPATVDSKGAIEALQCPSASLCVAVDSAGQALTSSDPGAGASSWTAPATIDAANFIGGLDCPATTLCVATDGAGNAITATGAGSGPLTWSKAADIDGATPLGGNGFSFNQGDVDCPTASVCVIGDQNGNVIVSSSSGLASPPGPTPPANTGPPAITGTPKARQRLSCSQGTWTNTPTSFTYSWSRDGTPIVGATTSSYTVQTTDEGLTLTCGVTASNAAGSTAPATSRGVLVPVPKVKRCPAATGSLHGSTLGRVRLGMTRAQARHAYTKSSNRGKAYQDFFCLTPIGVRVGYGSPSLLKKLAKAERTRFADRVVWASTSNAYYSVDGVRPGATVAAAEKLIKLDAPLHIGRNEWYLGPAAGATAVLKVRSGVVQEIGIGDLSLTGTLAKRRVFMSSFT